MKRFVGVGTAAVAVALAALPARAADTTQAGGSQPAGRPTTRAAATVTDGQGRPINDWLLHFVLEMVIEDYIQNGSNNPDELAAIIADVKQWYEDLMSGSMGTSSSGSSTTGSGGSTSSTGTART